MDIQNNEIIVIYLNHKCKYEGPFGELSNQTKEMVEDCTMLFRLNEFGKDWLAILDY